MVFLRLLVLFAFWSPCLASVGQDHPIEEPSEKASAICAVFPNDVWHYKIIPRLDLESLMRLRGTCRQISAWVHERPEFKAALNKTKELLKKATLVEISLGPIDKIMDRSKNPTGHHTCKKNCNLDITLPPCCYFQNLRTLVLLRHMLPKPLDLKDHVRMLVPARYCQGVDRVFVETEAKQLGVPVPRGLWDKLTAWKAAYYQYFGSDIGLLHGIEISIVFFSLVLKLGFTLDNLKENPLYLVPEICNLTFKMPNSMICKADSRRWCFRSPTLTPLPGDFSLNYVVMMTMASSLCFLVGSISDSNCGIKTDHGWFRDSNHLHTVRDIYKYTEASKRHWIVKPLKIAFSIAALGALGYYYLCLRDINTGFMTIPAAINYTRPNETLETSLDCCRIIGDEYERCTRGQYWPSEGAKVYYSQYTEMGYLTILTTFMPQLYLILRIIWFVLTA